MRRAGCEEADESPSRKKPVPSPNHPRVAALLPNRAGVGLKPEHIDTILAERPDVGFFEIHAENYMGDGGPPHRRLEAIRSLYPVSLHGVGLSIGSPRPLDKAHLARLAALAKRYEPGLFSEHLAWSSHDLGFLDDLLPLPYTEETLACVCAHIEETQEALGRRMLLENPSTYVLFAESAIPETEFLAEIARRTGCGLLLDVNNLHVNAVNFGFDPVERLAELSGASIGQIHLAGHAVVDDCLIDTHGSPVSDPVWSLYAEACRRFGPKPTLIEWDTDLPALDVLLAEAARATAVSGHVPESVHA